jgi:hypothetical protein
MSLFVEPDRPEVAELVLIERERLQRIQTRLESDRDQEAAGTVRFRTYRLNVAGPVISRRR